MAFSEEASAGVISTLRNPSPKVSRRIVGRSTWTTPKVEALKQAQEAEPLR